VDSSALTATEKQSRVIVVSSLFITVVFVALGCWRVQLQPSSILFQAETLDRSHNKNLDLNSYHSAKTCIVHRVALLP